MNRAALCRIAVAVVLLVVTVWGCESEPRHSSRRTTIDPLLTAWIEEDNHDATKIIPDPPSLDPRDVVPSDDMLDELGVIVGRSGTGLPFVTYDESEIPPLMSMNTNYAVSAPAGSSFAVVTWRGHEGRLVVGGETYKMSSSDTAKYIVVPALAGQKLIFTAGDRIFIRVTFFGSP